ncbi:MAG: phosphoribosyl-AMP cyclohydrolase [Rhizobiales bacterium]|nr:phosphoribosyl-AMP cyclohydrolase [Hyphomicrobiales bacterium]
MHDKELEEGNTLTPRFDANGLISAIVTDEKTGEVLMLAHMNADALKRTIETREGWFWSRSRKSLWKKGESSGNVLRVSEMKVDCDQDAVLLKVSVTGDGKTCHTGRRSCFYRAIPLGGGNTTLTFD